MHTLPSLPYAFDALTPHIDARTMEIHYTKHHQGYIDKLNAALKDTPYADTDLHQLLTTLDILPPDLQTPVRNHGGGHANHSLFWTILSPTPTQPSEAFIQVVDQDLGGYDQFVTDFTTAASTLFGSGWAWLTLENDQLHICTTPNQDSPLLKSNTPILGLDVWEHAYYLNYQNRRPDYIQAFFQLINWPQVEANYTAAKA